MAALWIFYRFSKKAFRSTDAISSSHLARQAIQDDRLLDVASCVSSGVILGRTVRRPDPSSRQRKGNYLAFGAGLPDLAGVFSVALRARVLSRIAVCFFLRTFSRAFSLGIG